MALIDFLERKKELALKVFTKSELEIIRKQAKGIRLTQSEKNVLSRSIRKKFRFIKECSIYQEEFTLKKGQDSKKEIEEFIEQVAQNKNIKTIYLFGSFLRKDFDEQSDIDIAIAFQNISGKEATTFLKETQAILPEHFDISVYNNLPEKIKKEIQENGRKIYENTREN